MYALPAFPRSTTYAAVPVRPNDVGDAITRAYHEEWARVLATLTKLFGDLDVAEEAAAEAFATAVDRWRADGVPPNPGGWLTTTARRKALDRIRREHKRDDKHEQAQMMHDDVPRSVGRRRRRPAQADLHLLPPGACPRRPRRVDAPHGRRSDRA